MSDGVKWGLTVSGGCERGWSIDGEWMGEVGMRAAAGRSDMWEKVE